MTDVFYVRGGDKSAPNICYQSGMDYGTRHDYKPYAPVHMLDVNWKKYDWLHYLSLVSAYRPALALVPDFEHISQLDTLLERVAAISTLGAVVLVCPKFAGAVQHIPESCRIAVSVETSYAGFEPEPDELYGRELHLLGGHPDQQAYHIHHKYTRSKVASVDGNILGYKAALGQVWEKGGRWAAISGRTTESLAIESGSVIIDYLRAPKVIKSTRRVKRSAQISLFHTQAESA